MKKVVWYSLIMLLLIVAEFTLPYKNGLYGWYLYVPGILKIVMCRLMVFVLFKDGSSNGINYKYGSLLFNILSLIFLVEFLGNFVFAVSFPRNLVEEAYVFFAFALVVELVVSSFAIINTLSEHYEGEHQSIIAFFAGVSFITTIYMAYVLVSSYFIPHNFRGFGVHVAILLLIRELVLFLMPRKEPAKND